MIAIEENVALSPLTSWQVGGAADFFFAPKNENEVAEALTWVWKNKQPMTVLSGGTNVLVSDKGVRGLVLHLKNLVGIEVLNVDNPFT